MNILPECGKTYTLDQVYNELQLRDSPFLMFYRKGEREVIQSQTVDVDTETLFKALPDIAKTKWTYIRETSEWIPLFILSSKEDHDAFFKKYLHGHYCPDYGQMTYHFSVEREG